MIAVGVRKAELANESLTGMKALIILVDMSRSWGARLLINSRTAPPAHYIHQLAVGPLQRSIRGAGEFICLEQDT